MEKNNVSKKETSIKEVILKAWNLLVKHIMEVFLVIIGLFYLVTCVIYLTKNREYDFLGPAILIIIIYALIYMLLSKVKSERKVKILIVVSSILLYSLWAIISKTDPYSDYAVLIKGAKDVLNGTFSQLTFDKADYFFRFNFQVGFVYYLAGIMKLFGTSLTSLKIMEIIILSISNLLIYIISSKIYNKKIGLVTAVLYTTLLFNIGGSSIINNQHISMLFILLGLYFLICHEKINFKILSIISITIAVILRPNALLLVFGIILFYIWKIFRDSFKDWFKYVQIILVFIAGYMMITKSYDFIMVKTKVVPISAVNGNISCFKLVLGMQPVTMGIFDNSGGLLDDLVKVNFNEKEYQKACKSYVARQYQHNTKNVMDFIFDKIVFFTSDPDNQIGFAGIIQIRDAGKATIYFGYTQYILLVLFTVAYPLLKDKFSDKKDWVVLFEIVFILYFMIHILIEVQTRYRYEQYAMLAVIASPILYVVLSKIEIYFQKIRKKINQI